LRLAARELGVERRVDPGVEVGEQLALHVRIGDAGMPGTGQVPSKQTQSNALWSVASKPSSAQCAPVRDAAECVMRLQRFAVWIKVSAWARLARKTRLNDRVKLKLRKRQRSRMTRI